MSIVDFRSTRTDNNKVVKLVREICDERIENVVISPHAEEQMRDRDLISPDIFNVLLSTSSRVWGHDFEKGSYRYQYGTKAITVVIAFWSNGKGLNVVTAFRKKRK